MILIFPELKSKAGQKRERSARTVERAEADFPPSPPLGPAEIAEEPGEETGDKKGEKGR